MHSKDAERLEIIDRLHGLRLDQYVALPMLIVVGDQSSGKSSVLEGLTGLPFARASSLCTRHPTHVVFQRGQVSHVKVSIGAYGQVSESKARHLDAFHARYQSLSTPLRNETFADVIQSAAECMGLSLFSSGPGHNQSETQSAFSEDTLKIELTGPEYQHFSVVDLPGLFRTSTPGQTTTLDIDVVRNLVRRYVENPRCIILAVVPANVDKTTQEIIRMAEEADPGHRRTLGVLTKPDIVDQGAEQAVVDMVCSTADSPTLGFVLVRNRKQSEQSSSLEDRNDTEEHFFTNHAPWNLVPRDRRGIPALKKRLDDILVQITRETFGDVAADVGRKLESVRSSYRQLGPSRDTPSLQRRYLVQIASRYQVLTANACDAYYHRDRVFKESPLLRLATRVRLAHEEFGSYFRRYGPSFRFDAGKRANTNPASAATNTDSAGPNDESHSDSESEDLLDEKTATYSLVEKEQPEDVASLRKDIDRIFGSSTRLRPEAGQPGIRHWIRQEYDECRGFEMGTVNPSLLPSLFAQQTTSWLKIAMLHVRNSVMIVHTFIHTALNQLCADRAVAKRIWVRLQPQLQTNYQQAFDHVNLLIQAETKGRLITTNHYFANTVSKLRMRRYQRRLPKPHTNLGEIAGFQRSNEDDMVDELFDTLWAYYKVAEKRFIDNVCLQVVDWHLMGKDANPLLALSPELVSEWTDAELSEIGGESAETSDKRTMLAREMEALTAGLRILEETLL